MKKQNIYRIFLTLGIALIFILPATSLSINTNQKTNELITFDYNNQEELIVTCNLQDLQQGQIVVDNDVYTTFQITNTGFLGYLGKPQLPVISRLIAVPTTDVDFEIVGSNYQTVNAGKIYPAQSPQTDDGGSFDFVIDEEFYQQDIVYPGKIAEIIYDGKIRDISFVKIEFYPVNYNPKQEIALVYNEITIKLSWENEIVNVESGFEESSFFNLYKNTFSNWPKFLQNTQISEEPKESGREPGADYILITHENFYSEAKALADWKHQKGYMTKLVNLSDIGSSANDIQNYIQNAYDTWNPRPSYLCLVGDAELMPTNYEYSAASDLWYVTVSGSDYYPDMFTGRIPADTSQEANIMIQKILNYEQNPPTKSDFYENFAVAAYFQDDEGNGYETRRFVRTSEEIRDYLMSIGYAGERIYVTESYINPTHYNNGYYGNGEPLPAELLRANGFAWDGDADDIINAVNDGVFILNHRDHGANTYWGDPYFDTGHIDQLANGELLPIVFSINCLTGHFDNEECFCEHFVRKENGGAVGIFGATRTSYSGYNDWMCRGFYDAMWPDFDTEQGDDTHLYTLGEMLNYGKAYMANTWGDPWGYERLTFELFHVFCDPSLEIWSALPEDLDVTYTLSAGEMEVTVTGTGGPVEGARVGLSQESGFYANGITSTSGSVVFDTMSANILEQVTLVASIHDYKPSIQTFFLNQVPAIPDKPDGPPNGGMNKEYTFSTSTIDADGDQVYYMWRWGDGHYSEWIGPFDSGETTSASHSWQKTGNFKIRVKAKDTNDQETGWSEELMFNIQKSKSINSQLLRFLQNFPNLYSILKVFFNL